MSQVEEEKNDSLIGQLLKINVKLYNLCLFRISSLQEWHKTPFYYFRRLGLTMQCLSFTRQWVWSEVTTQPMLTTLSADEI